MAVFIIIYIYIADWRTDANGDIPGFKGLAWGTSPKDLTNF
jgi:hypothetical protein